MKSVLRMWSGRALPCSCYRRHTVEDPVEGFRGWRQSTPCCTIAQNLSSSNTLASETKSSKLPIKTWKHSQRRENQGRQLSQARGGAGHICDRCLRDES